MLFGMESLVLRTDAESSRRFCQWRTFALDFKLIQALTGHRMPRLSYLDQIVSSADGTKLASWAYMKQLFVSTDSGATWSIGNSATANWTAVAASADGARLAACVRGGGIFIAQSTLAPKLNMAVAETNLALSWVIPSTNFVLQQSSDCTHQTGWL